MWFYIERLKVRKDISSPSKFKLKNDQKKDNPAITVTSRDTLQHVCNLLSTHSIHRVYIVDHLLRPCGVVSIADVLQAIVAPNVPFDIMQCPVVFNRIHSNMIAQWQRVAQH